MGKIQNDVPDSNLVGKPVAMAKRDSIMARERVVGVEIRILTDGLGVWPQFCEVEQSQRQ
jgi:hypothetical protein